MKRLGTFLWLIPLALIVLCAGRLSLAPFRPLEIPMDYVPDSGECRRWGEDFIVGENVSIQGLYANLDVPCTVFRYPIWSPDPVGDIARAAKSRGWKCTALEANRAYFQRVDHSSPHHSGTLARIRVTHGRVYVAQVVDRPGSRNWADHWLWPKLDEYVAAKR